MKKYYYRLPLNVLLLLVLVLSTGLWQTSGLTEEKPAQAAPGNLQNPSTKPRGMSKMFEGKVMEVIHAGRHIYVSVKTGEELFWIAVMDFDGKPGDKVIVPPGVPVADFHSKELNRTFKIIYFVGGIRESGSNTANSEKSKSLQSNPAAAPAGKKMIHPPVEDFTSGTAVDIGKVEKAKGGKTVFEIISERKNLAGQYILLRAKVTRFTPNIMGKNWIRVRDGSGGQGQNELVVATNDKTRVGDVILIRGIVSVDRDFGFGKKYKVIVENAEITAE